MICSLACQSLTNGSQAGQTRLLLCTRDQRRRLRRLSGWIQMCMTFDGSSRVFPLPLTPLKSLLLPMPRNPTMWAIQHHRALWLQAYMR